MKVIKYIFLSIILIVFYNILEFGPRVGKVEQLLYPTVLCVLTLTSFAKRVYRRVLLGLSISSFTLMAFVYLLGEISLASTVGSIGFSLLLISLISYSKSIFRNGYIEQL